MDGWSRARHIAVARHARPRRRQAAQRAATEDGGLQPAGEGEEPEGRRAEDLHERLLEGREGAQCPAREDEGLQQASDRQEGRRTEIVHEGVPQRIEDLNRPALTYFCPLLLS